MKGLLSAIVFLLFLVPDLAVAQSVPNQLRYGQVPTAGQWTQAFASKQDALGFRPLNAGGDTMTGKLWLMPSTSFNSGINCGVGNTPTTPQNGDIWCTSVGMYVQVAGVTIGPLMSSGLFGPGSSTNGDLATWANGSGSLLADSPLGANVLAALGVALNAQNGLPKIYSASIIAGDCLQWGPGIQDAGAACGGGNVSNAGTPANTQIAQWTGATTIQGIAVPSGFWTAMGYSLNASGGFVTNVATALGYTPAHNGANSDITSLTGVTTPIPVSEGGTGASTQGATAANNIGAAAKSANSDITSLSGLTTPLSTHQGGTGVISPVANTVPLNEGTAPQSNTGTGSAGQVLMSNGAGVDPSFQTLPSTVPTTFGAVGTYVPAFYNGTISAGSTISGSSLTYYNESSGAASGGGTLSGTWRMMGFINYSYMSSLWLRISLSVPDGSFVGTQGMA